MKKIFFAAFSLLALLLTTSCSNDEIEIDKVGRRYNLNFNISTQGIYDKFDLTNDVRDQFFRDGSRAIGVFSYLYDQNGRLVQNQQTILSTYNTTTHLYEKLEEGSYTLVAIEFLVNPDINNTSEDWSIEGVESLSTIKVKCDGILGWASILGVSTQAVSLVKNTDINIEPEAVGARINFYCFNFGNATDLNENGVPEAIVNLGLATSDVLESYNLNPQLLRKDKFTENLTTSGYTNVRVTITPEESEQGYYRYFYIVESEVTWRFSWQNESSNLWYHYTNLDINASIEDGKTYHAGFYFLGEDYFPSTFFSDNYNGLVDWKQNCDDFLTEISQSSGLYAIPYLNWSVGTVSAVKSYMNNFLLHQDVTMNTDGKYELTYFDITNNYTMYEYEFTSSTSGLTDAYVYLDNEYFTLNQVREEIEKQGFTFNSQNNNNYYYTGTDTYVTVYQSTSGMILVDYYNPKAYGLAPKHEIPMTKVNVNKYARPVVKGITATMTKYPKSYSVGGNYTNKEAKKVFMK